MRWECGAEYRISLRAAFGYDKKRRNGGKDAAKRTLSKCIKKASWFRRLLKVIALLVIQ